MGARQARSAAIRALPKDMIYLKKKVAALADHTGLPEDEDEDEEGDEEQGLVENDKLEDKEKEVAAASEDTSEDEEVEKWTTTRLPRKVAYVVDLISCVCSRLVQCCLVIY